MAAKQASFSEALFINTHTLPRFRSFFNCCGISEFWFSNSGFLHRYSPFRMVAILVLNVVYLLFSAMISPCDGAVLQALQLVNNTGVGVNGAKINWTGPIQAALAGIPVVPPKFVDNPGDWGFAGNMGNPADTIWMNQMVIPHGGLLNVRVRQQRVPGFNGAGLERAQNGNWFLNPNGVMAPMLPPQLLGWMQVANQDRRFVDLYVENITNSVIYYSGLTGFESIPIEHHQLDTFWEERTRGSAVSLLASQSGLLNPNESLLVATLRIPTPSEYYTFGVFSGVSSDPNDHLFQAFSYSVPEPNSMIIYLAIGSVCGVFRRKPARIHSH
ncbi:MAG: hypothetical protein ACKOBW_00010 [Planctomycetota bacterium]